MSRAQAVELGLTDNDLRRLRRRRELTPLWPGVYVDHTGSPSWIQRAWGAVLAAWPAALSHESALRIVEGPGSRRSEALIEVVVHRDRRLVRARGCPDPPQCRPGGSRAVEPVTAARALRRGCRSTWPRGHRTTSPAWRCWRRPASSDGPRRSGWRPRSTLARGWPARPGSARCSATWPRVCARPWSTATFSAVERAHGLSRARRQVRDRVGAGVVYRDAEYVGGLIVELDGRLFHDSTTQRDSDFDRDLEAMVDGKESVRLSWGQVVREAMLDRRASRRSSATPRVDRYCPSVRAWLRAHVVDPSHEVPAIHHTRGRRARFSGRR